MSEWIIGGLLCVVAILAMKCYRQSQRINALLPLQMQIQRMAQDYPISKLAQLLLGKAGVGGPRSG